MRPSPVLMLFGTGLSLASLHQCLYPEDHLRRFFLSPGQEQEASEAAQQVMRWLGFSNLAASVFGIMLLMKSNTLAETKQLATVVGGLCLVDVAFVKVPYSKSVVVNANISRIVGPCLGVGGLGLIIYGMIGSL